MKKFIIIIFAVNFDDFISIECKVVQLDLVFLELLVCLFFKCLRVECGGSTPLKQPSALGVFFLLMPQFLFI